jgi:hypothetical protein
MPPSVSVPSPCGVDRRYTSVDRINSMTDVLSFWLCFAAVSLGVSVQLSGPSRAPRAVPSSIRTRFNPTPTSTFVSSICLTRQLKSTRRGPPTSIDLDARRVTKTQDNWLASIFSIYDAKECIMQISKRLGPYVYRGQTRKQVCNVVCRMSKRAVRLAWNRKSKMEIAYCLCLSSFPFRISQCIQVSSLGSLWILRVLPFCFWFISTVPCLSMTQRQECILQISRRPGPYPYLPTRGTGQTRPVSAV